MTHCRPIVRMLAAAAILGSTVLLSPAFAQKTTKPLSEVDIVRLLKGQVSPMRVETLARRRGISFELTRQTESELRQAGATDSLLETLRELAPRPPGDRHAKVRALAGPATRSSVPE